MATNNYNLARIKSVVLNSKTHQTDPALYQSLIQMIDLINDHLKDVDARLTKLENP
jgi:hypothetical protein